MFWAPRKGIGILKSREGGEEEEDLTGLGSHWLCAAGGQ